VDGVSQALRSTDHKQPVKIADPIVERGNIKFEANYPSGNQKSGIMSTEGECRSLTATDYKQPPSIVLPVSAEDAQAKTKPGLFIKVSEELTVYAIWYEKYQQYIAIRKLTPKECFRLQGWSDDYFERAALVNSNSQLYKQAGNGVTVNVIKAMAERMK
jgi:DNA (cytosine-5)-methyltransferase 1